MREWASFRIFTSDDSLRKLAAVCGWILEAVGDSGVFEFLLRFQFFFVCSTFSDKRDADFYAFMGNIR